MLWILPVNAEQLTIAALGDSLTAGYGLAPSEGFVPQLQAWLLARGADVVVQNAGVSGDTTAGGVARLDWTLTPDVDALIVTLGGNDLLRGIDPAESRANLETILKSATARGLPVLMIGMQAPGNYGPEYKASFDAIYPELSRQYKTLFTPAFFAGLGSDPALVQEFMQADGLHPNFAGVTKIVENLGPSVQELLQKIPK
jgi:acyl-CoA thioesterase-1